jgi:hypothetical protein
LLKLEPSAHIPWQKTMLGLVVFISNLAFLGFHCCFSLRLSLLVRWPLAFLHHPRSDIRRGVQHQSSKCNPCSIANHLKSGRLRFVVILIFQEFPFHEENCVSAWVRETPTRNMFFDKSVSLHRQCHRPSPGDVSAELPFFPTGSQVPLTERLRKEWTCKGPRIRER